jgi:enamine deaminase RidA (YjgF/YER057c/UK114 family)
MAGTIEARLATLGIVLPVPAAPVANYVPWVVTGDLVFIAGQVTLVDGKPQFIGQLGREFGVEDGAKAARLCAVNILAQVKAACGDLDRVARCVKLTGFVSATADFKDHPKVVNGASDLMVEAFGDKGRHARAAVGVASLPLGVAVEVDAIFQIA